MTGMAMEGVAVASYLLEQSGVFVDGECRGPSLSATLGVITWERTLRNFGYTKELSVGVDEDEGAWFVFMYDEEILSREKAYSTARQRAALLRKELECD
jgi:hypothetical protein